MASTPRICLVILPLVLLPVGCRTGGARVGGKTADSPRAERPAFPQAWAGTWAGVCTAERPDAWDKQFKMELRIRPTSKPNRWQWKLIYGEGAEQSIRDYELVQVDPAAGHYRIDERNSIVLDSYLIGSTLYCQFSLDQSLLTTSYTLQGDKLLFEIVVSRLDQTVETGGMNDTPTVLGYPVKVAQRAQLSRLGAR